MDIREFYTRLGADSDTLLRRLGNEERIRKYLKKMLDDKSFDTLAHAMRDSDFAQAFLSAHTIKGMSANLEFLELSRSSSALTEALRSDAPDVALAEKLFEEVRQGYNAVIELIMLL